MDANPLRDFMDASLREVPPAGPGAVGRLLEAACSALDKLSRGVLLLAPTGDVRYVNRAARAMLQRRRGIELQHGRLAFGDPTVTVAFAGMLGGGGGSLVLRLRGAADGGGGFRLLVSPLDGQSANGGYCVFIYEPHRGHRPLPAQVLRELYELTAAETRLANALYSGRTLQEAAGMLGVSLNTAKSTLKRVFAKCEVGSQAELLQLLSLGPRTV